MLSAGIKAQKSVLQIDSLIDAGYKATEPGGVVLVAKGNNILYERAFGMANLELNVPMKKDMVFCIGSVTKQFTAIAILQLTEQGKLALTDTVGKFLPNYPAHLKQVTIHQLLTHTAGIPNAKNISQLVGLGRGWRTAEQVMATFRDLPLDFIPGTSFAYSNSGYQLLGLILETVTGQPYAEYMDKYMLLPAGMNHSLYGNDMKLVPNRASPYLYTRNGIENACNSNVQIAFSAGALQATVADFLKWQQALVSGKFIGKALLQKAWTRATLQDKQPVDYGYGWFAGTFQEVPIVEHGGNMGGFMSHVMYVPSKDILVAVFFNFRGKLPELLAQDIMAIVLDKPLRIAEISLPVTILQSYTGQYQDSRGIIWSIRFEQDKLFMQKKDGPKWQLIPYEKDRFYFPNTSTIGQIQRDINKNIIGFLMQTRTGMSRNELKKIGEGDHNRSY